MKKIISMFVFCFYIFIFPIELTLIKKLPTGNAPKSIVISPDGEYAYVNNLESCSVWKYSVSEKKIVKKIQFMKTPAIGFNYETKEEIPSFAEKPVEADFSDNGKNLWISLHNAEEVVVYDTDENDYSGNDSRQAEIHDLLNNTKKKISLKAIKVGKTPKVVKTSPDNKWLYVANWHSNDISVIDIEKQKNVKTISVIHIPRGIDFHSDSNYAYIANMGASTANVIDTKNGNSKLYNIEIGLNPRHICISDDNAYIYSTHNLEKTFHKTDLKTKKIIKKLFIGERPRTFVLSKCGQFAFILSYDDDELVIVDVDRMEIINRIKTGLKPIGASITPDGKELWITNYFEATIYIYNITY